MLSVLCISSFVIFLLGVFILRRVNRIFYFKVILDLESFDQNTQLRHFLV